MGLHAASKRPTAFVLSNPLPIPRYRNGFQTAEEFCQFSQQPAGLMPLASSQLLGILGGISPQSVWHVVLLPAMGCSLTQSYVFSPSLLAMDKRVLLLKRNVFHTFRISYTTQMTSFCSKQPRFPIAYGIRLKVLMLLLKVLFFSLILYSFIYISNTSLT